MLSSGPRAPQPPPSSPTYQLLPAQYLMARRARDGFSKTLSHPSGPKPSRHLIPASVLGRSPPDASGAAGCSGAAGRSFGITFDAVSAGVARVTRASAPDRSGDGGVRFSDLASFCSVA